MANTLYRLGRWAFRHWKVVIALWLVALIGLGALAGAIKQPMKDTFSIPGIPSEQAQTLQQELFPNAKSAFDQANATIVVAAPTGHTLKEPQYAKAVDALLADLKTTPQLSKTAMLVNPVVAQAGLEQQLLAAAKQNGQPEAVVKANAAAIGPLSPDARIGTIGLEFDVAKVTDVKPDSQKAVLAKMDKARASGLAAEVNGSGMESYEMPQGSSELIGLALAALVLILTFGSLIAAGMPIFTAIIGVGMGSLAVSAATAFTEIGTTTPMLATMLGLAVGIDYALFILSRYRTEARHTDDREEAAGLAVGRAGSAVVFAGLTVIIALSALSVVRIPFLTSMGLAAAFTVLMAVCIALTLLPAILGMFKGKAFGLRVRKEDTHDDDAEVVNGGTRWARLVAKRPLVFGLVVTALLALLVIPVKDLHLALPTDSTAPVATSARKAADLISEGFGPGRQGPLLLVVDARKAGSTPAQTGPAIGAVTQWAATQEDVANAQVIAMNKEGTGAQILITPKSSADDPATEALLHRLRDGQPTIEQSSKTTLGVTGLTAIQADVSERLTGALAPYLAIVVGLAFLLLMLVFRSILVPLTATLGFLLSVLATIGATILVFQKGVFGIFDPAPLMSFMPILVIGIVFGLAMDYQVFLVTRMREAYVHGDTAPEAVVDGFRHGARVVAAAATIMISVFAAFIAQDNPLIQSIGFALATAVLLDAFLIRMTLIPATMYLLGDKAWWLPSWLDRILPRVDVEGEALQRTH